MKRIMFFMLSVMLVVMTANAQITEGRIGTGDITIWGVTYNDAYGLDFDNDGVLEFRISDFSGYPTIYNGGFGYEYEEDGSNIMADESQWDYVGVLEAGVTVGPSSAEQFRGYGDGYFDYENIELGTHYLGFRIKLSDGVHYGWAEYTMAYAGDDYIATFNRCYYNATVGESIETGDTGDPAGCVAQTLTFSENFDALDSELPDCWGQEAQAAHLAKWGVSSAGYSGKCLVFSDYLNVYSYLTLPTFDLSAADNGAQLRLMYKNPYTDYLDNTTIKFYYRTDHEAEWTLITGEDITDAHNSWEELTVMLPESRNASVYEIAIWTKGMDAYARCYTYVDDVHVESAPNCPQPTSLTVSNINATGAILEWEENGTATEWSLKVNDGEWETINENPYTMTGLTAQTSYNVHVRSICGTSDTSTIADVSFETLCAVEEFPYSENFETLSSGLPNCWEQDNSYTSSVWGFTSSGNTGNGLVFNDYYGFYSRLIMSVVDCSSQSANAQLTFNYKNPVNTSSKNITLKIYYRTSAEGEWTEISDASITSAAEEWTLAEIELPNSANAPYYQVSILATGVSTYPMLYAYIDDVRIDVMPSCVKPTDLEITDIRDSDATLGWTENGTATEWVIQINGGEWTTIDANPYTIGGLTGSMNYTVKLRSFCGGTDTSSVATTTFRTACAQISLPYSENFENMEESEAPICWTTLLSDYYGDYPVISSDAGNPGLGVLCYGTDSYKNMIVSPQLPVNANTCNLIFDAKIMNYESAYLEVGVMTDPNNVSTFTRVDSIGGKMNGDTWKTYEIDMSLVSEIAASNAQYVAFRFTGSYDYCRIDNVLIEAAPSCKKPSNLDVEATESGMTVSWTENGTATEWLVKIGNGEWEETTTNPYVKSGLESNTEYSVSVRAYCGGTDTSSVLSGTCRTECAAEEFPYREGFESYASGAFPDCWKKLSVECSVVSSSSYASNGVKALRLRSGAMIATPKINVGGNDVNIEFDLQRTGTTAGKMAVGVAASQSLAETAVYMDTIEPATTYTYDRYGYVYHNTQNLQTICIVFKQIGNTSTYEYYYLDSVVVSNPPSCPRPVGLTAAATDESLTIDWTEDGTATEWLVKVGEGNWELVDTKPYTKSGLQLGTDYEVSVRAYCGGTDTSEVTTETFRTECGTESFPYSESFEVYESSTTSFPYCWTLESGTSYVVQQNGYSAYASDGVKALKMAGNAMVVSPMINIGGSDVTIKFDLRREGTTDAGKMAVGFAPLPSMLSMVIYIDTITPEASYEFNTYDYTFANTMEIGSGCIVFKQIESTTTYYYYFIDNVRVELPPTCPKPTDLEMTAATESSLTLSWNESGSATQWLLKVDGGEYHLISANPYTLNGLDVATAYEVEIRALCGAGDTSEAVTGIFSTECGVISYSSLPYFEGFENGLSCWTQEVISGTKEWAINSSSTYNSGNIAIPEGAKYVCLYGAYDGEVRLISPVFDMSGIVNVKLSFAHIQKAWGGDQDKLKVEYRLSASGEWQELANYTSEINYWQNDTLTLPEVSSEMQIAFYGKLGFGYGAAVDMVALEGESTIVCDVPTAVAVSGVNETEATVTWTGTAASYEVVVTDTETGSETSYTTTSNTLTLNDLNVGTAYSVKVRALCDGGVTSGWSEAESFSTWPTADGDCEVPTNVSVSAASDRATISWTGTASEYQIRVTGGEQPITLTVSASPYTVEGLAGETSYTVEIRAICGEGDSSEWTAPISFETTAVGIDEVDGSFSINIYPNPTRSNATITLEGVNGTVRVEVVDMSGRMVLSEAVECNQGCAKQLNVSTLAQGSYFVRVSGEEVNAVKKLIVR